LVNFTPLGVTTQESPAFTHGECQTGYLDDEGEIAFCIYKTYDGNAFAEVFQQEIWEYGPNIFTCLIDLRKPTELLFKWTKEEMER